MFQIVSLFAIIKTVFVQKDNIALFECISVTIKMIIVISVSQAIIEPDSLGNEILILSLSVDLVFK